MTDDNAPQIGGQGQRTGDEPELKGQRPLCCDKPMQVVDATIDGQRVEGWRCAACDMFNIDTRHLEVGEHGVVISFKGRELARMVLTVTAVEYADPQVVLED